MKTSKTTVKESNGLKTDKGLETRTRVRGNLAQLSDYMGKGDTFDQAIADFAEAYGDQSEQDHAALLKAVRSSRLKATVER